MSFTAKRAELATVLTAAHTKVTGYEFRPTVITAGAAWPLLREVVRGPGDAFGAVWACVVCLGGDERAAQDLLDEVLPDLVDAIDPHAYVQSATPRALETSGGDMFAVEIRGLSE